METAIARIERLERGNRRMLIALLGLVALFAASVTMVRSSDGTRRATSLSIVDDNGRERVLLGGVSSGSVLALSDSRDRLRLGLVASTDNAAVRLFNGAGAEIVSLESQRSDGGLLFTATRAGAFFGTVAQSPGISMFASGNSAKLSLGEGWAPSFIATDASKTDRVWFGQSQSGDFTGGIAGKSADSTDYSMP